MKRAKIQLLVALIALGSLLVINLIAHYGYFQAVESSSGIAPSKSKNLAQLQELTNQLKNVSDEESAKKVIKFGENQIIAASSGAHAEKFRSAFAPVLKTFSEKPKDTDAKQSLALKRDLMEGMVNAYRKEIPNGPIALRASYLNILFDVQNSLVNESDEAELVFLRKVKERMQGLKAFVEKSGDQALLVRVNSLDSIFLSYEKNFEALQKWKKDKSAVLAKTEKNLPQLSEEILGKRDGQLEDSRRFFLYSSMISLIVSALALAAVFLFYKVGKLKYEASVADFSRFLSRFGQERVAQDEKRLVESLSRDPNWESIVASVLEAENKFIASFQTLIAIPQSMSTPYLVFSREGLLQHSSDSALSLFSVSGKSYSLDNFLASGLLSSREGETEAVVHMIQNSFASPKVDTFELCLMQDGIKVPYELLSYPIVRGPLAGGKVFLFREIRNEMRRIEASVKGQLMVVREAIYNIHHGKNLNLEKENCGDEVLAALENLEAMKLHLDEQSLRRATERDALLDQVRRQKEILERLGAGMSEVRSIQTQALNIVSEIHEQDENWHDEVRVLERDMERWALLREKLEVELGRYAETMRKAKFYEEDLRSATAQIESFLGDFEAILSELNQFGDRAKLHAVNMSFASDPKQREIAANARAYAFEMGKFVSLASEVGQKLRKFLREHPGNSLVPILDSSDFDEVALDSFEQEEGRLNGFVKRWSSNGDELLERGEQALQLLKNTDKTVATLSQLGETSLVINGQTEGNVSRWN